MSCFKIHKYHVINNDDFTERIFFEDLHHYEIFNELMYYDKETFVMDYGKGIITYQFELWTIWFNSGNNNMQYVVAKERLNDKEKSQLGKYCSCDYCSANIFNRWFKSPYYCGCITYDISPNQKYIDVAKMEFKNDVGFIKKYLFMA